jgi:hypothetical protein
VGPGRSLGNAIGGDQDVAEQGSIGSDREPGEEVLDAGIADRALEEGAILASLER